MRVTSDHMQIMQRIVAFVQEQGWEIRTVNIQREREGLSIFSGGEALEEWKKSGMPHRWNLMIECGPRPEKELQERKLIND